MNILESQKKKRFECLKMILQWNGAKIGDGQYERVSVNSLDKKQNTPLHFAAKSGLKQCVEVNIEKKYDSFSKYNFSIFKNDSMKQYGDK